MFADYHCLILAAAVTPEVGYEMEMQSQTHYVHIQRTIEILLSALRLLQDELGASQYTVRFSILRPCSLETTAVYSRAV